MPCFSFPFILPKSLIHIVMRNGRGGKVTEGGYKGEREGKESNGGHNPFCACIWMAGIVQWVSQRGCLHQYNYHFFSLSSPPLNLIIDKKMTQK